MMSSLERPAQSFLLSAARDAIASRFGNPLRLDDEISYPPGVDRSGGAFVTLRLDGGLRGCIGRVESSGPLYETVAEVARQAAFEDPRFMPLTAPEFDRVSIEVSVLTPPERTTAENVTVGRDGLIIERGRARGLLLPQVAVEWGWDRETFLNQACRKAGISDSAWREPDTIIQSFQAQTFNR